MARLRLNGGTEIEEVDGRVKCGKDDWGPSINRGDPLPCCGCKLSFGGRDPEVCNCRCHTIHKQVFQPWMTA